MGGSSGGSPPGMAQTSHPGKMIYKWRPVTLLKQTETANISLNVNRDCISVIVDTPGKSWTTLEKSPGTAPALPSTVEEEYHFYKQIWEILFHWNSFFVRPCKFGVTITSTRLLPTSTSGGIHYSPVPFSVCNIFLISMVAISVGFWYSVDQ